jgi:hypothetical protein
MSELLDQERAAVAAGTAEPCGRVCDASCHGDLACLRAVHPQDPDNMTAHLGYTADDQLIQWVHP